MSTKAESVAKKRLSILRRAERTRNVRETCRRNGLSPTTFYEWRSRFKSGGLKALEPLSSAPKKHYRKVNAELTKQIVGFVKSGQLISFRSMTEWLEDETGVKICETTISNVLKASGIDFRNYPAARKGYSESLAEERRDRKREKKLADEY